MFRGRRHIRVLGLGVCVVLASLCVLVFEMWWNDDAGSRKTSILLPHQQHHLDRINVTNFINGRRLTLQPTHALQACSKGAIDVLAVVPTSPHNIAARSAIREGWAALVPRSWTVVFYIGASEHPSIQDLLSAESKTHKDIIQDHSFPDTYSTLTLKTLALFSWATQSCPSAKFVFKVDDDVFVNVAKLDELTKCLHLAMRNLYVTDGGAGGMQDAERTDHDRVPGNGYTKGTKTSVGDRRSGTLTNNDRVRGNEYTKETKTSTGDRKRSPLTNIDTANTKHDITLGNEHTNYYNTKISTGNEEHAGSQMKTMNGDTKHTKSPGNSPRSNIYKTKHSDGSTNRCNEARDLVSHYVDSKTHEYEPYVIGGYLYKNVRADRSLNSKWHLPVTLYADKILPPYLSGTAYLISANIVPYILKTAEKTPLITLEDVYLTGLVAANGLKLRLTHLHGFERFRPRFESPCVYRDLLTAHGFTSQELRVATNEAMGYGDGACDGALTKLGLAINGVITSVFPRLPSHGLTESDVQALI